MYNVLVDFDDMEPVVILCNTEVQRKNATREAQIHNNVCSLESVESDDDVPMGTDVTTYKQWMEH